MEPTTFHELELGPAQRGALLAPYDLSITVEGNRIELGRFSIGLLCQLRIIPAPGEARCLARIGAFCQAAPDSIILVDGEHRNESLLNYTFGGLSAVFPVLMSPEAKSLCGPKPGLMTDIGDNVVISAGSILLGGAVVGVGCVIGAGAVVRNAEPYGIYAGTPARRIAERFSPERLELYRKARLPEVMAHHLTDIPTLLHQLEEGEITLADYLRRVSFLPARPVVHLEGEYGPGGSLQLKNPPVGYSVGGKPITGEPAAALATYFGQMAGSGSKVRWLPDIFAALGLYG